LIFMGSEFVQCVEWREYEQLQWQVVDQYDSHKQTLHFFKKINDFYHNETALWQCDYDQQGIICIYSNNSQQRILSILRNS
ncbi:1,4-alpha-glucan branching enzyme, partial [Francisella tularensis subsp. holarctica]|nr:1,4-alpha-glucan branching enzyme [Francisella tularensis subsp. holarctica]